MMEPLHLHLKLSIEQNVPDLSPLQKLVDLIESHRANAWDYQITIRFKILNFWKNSVYDLCAHIRFLCTKCAPTVGLGSSVQTALATIYTYPAICMKYSVLMHSHPTTQTASVQIGENNDLATKKAGGCVHSHLCLKDRSVIFFHLRLAEGFMEGHVCVAFPARWRLIASALGWLSH